MSSASSPDFLHPTSPISPSDLRHMTSNSGLSSPGKEHRASQHLRMSDARVGSRSPTSIPSSPTSIHSSSSAIFERDIEPIVPPSPPHVPHHPPNPHRIPRSKGTEHLEHSVPSVLDSAAAILTSIEDAEGSEQVAVVAPAATSPLGDMWGARSSGFASPIGSLRSRSPSPLGARAGQQGREPSLLLNIPQPMSPGSHHLSSAGSAGSPQTAGSPQVVPTSLTSVPASAVIHVAPQLEASTSSSSDAPSTTPSIVTPTSAYFSTTSSVPSSSSSSSPKTTTLEHPPHPLLPALGSPVSPQTLASPSSTVGTSHPPSPSSAPTKRLSFMSYSDLLSSTPASTLPLSSLTTSASSEPPPHIPSVSGLSPSTGGSSHYASPTGSLRGFPMAMGGISHPGKRDSILLLDDLGGEWEREGLGRGLEERLERLIPQAGAGMGRPGPAAAVLGKA